MGRGFAQTRMHHAAESAIAPANNNPNEGVFLRIEDKYLIPQKATESFIIELKHVMPLSFPDPHTHFTYIKSCYLDSASLDFFQDHFRGLSERCKVRLRQYAPNGHWDSGMLLEIKQKKELESKKIRFFIPPEGTIKSGQQTTHFDCLALMELNPNLASLTLQKRVEKANALIREYGLAPRLNIIYHRLAFQRDDVRITIDTNISFTLEDPPSANLVQKIKSQEDLWTKALLLSDKFNVNENAILEVKHGGELPLWASDLLQKWQFQQTTFSKYCWAMTCVLQDYPRLKIA